MWFNIIKRNVQNMKTYSMLSNKEGQQEVRIGSVWVEEKP